MEVTLTLEFSLRAMRGLRPLLYCRRWLRCFGFTLIFISIHDPISQIHQKISLVVNLCYVYYWTVTPSGCSNCGGSEGMSWILLFFISQQKEAVNIIQAFRYSFRDHIHKRRHRQETNIKCLVKAQDFSGVFVPFSFWMSVNNNHAIVRIELCERQTLSRKRVLILCAHINATPFLLGVLVSS